jgi:hypothetical protein
MRVRGNLGHEPLVLGVGVSRPPAVKQEAIDPIVAVRTGVRVKHRD